MTNWMITIGMVFALLGAGVIGYYGAEGKIEYLQGQLADFRTKTYDMQERIDFALNQIEEKDRLIAVLQQKVATEEAYSNRIGALHRETFQTIKPFRSVQDVMDALRDCLHKVETPNVPSK